MGEVYRWAACVRACVTSNSKPCRQDQKNHRASQSHSLCTHRPSQHPRMKDALIRTAHSRKRARTRMYVPTGTKSLARSHTHTRTHALYTYARTCVRAGLLQVSFPSPRHTHVWLRCVALRVWVRDSPLLRRQHEPSRLEVLQNLPHRSRNHDGVGLCVLCVRRRADGGGGGVSRRTKQAPHEHDALVHKQRLDMPPR